MSFRYCLFVIICGGLGMASGHPNRRLIITGSLVIFNCRLTIMTSNRCLEEWGKFLSSRQTMSSTPAAQSPSMLAAPTQNGSSLSSLQQCDGIFANDTG
jgi:hypothetical protein